MEEVKALLPLPSNVNQRSQKSWREGKGGGGDVVFLPEHGELKMKTIFSKQ